MKMLKYKLCTRVNVGTKKKPQIEEIFNSVSMVWSPTTEEIAKREAYNGEYTIEDDGRPEKEPTATANDVLNTLLGVE